jgi:hypothetical protein
MSRNAPGESEADNYKYETPNNTIMIRGLAQHITENDVSVCKSKVDYICFLEHSESIETMLQHTSFCPC